MKQVRKNAYKVISITLSNSSAINGVKTTGEEIEAKFYQDIRNGVAKLFIVSSTERIVKYADKEFTLTKEVKKEVIQEEVKKAEVKQPTKRKREVSAPVGYQRKIGDRFNR